MYDFLLQLVQTSVVMSGVGLMFCAVRRLLGERYSAAGRRIVWLVVFAGYLMIWKPSLNGVYLYRACEAPAVSYMQGHVYVRGVAPQTILTVSRFLTVVWLLGVMVSLSLQLARHREFLETVRRLQLTDGAGRAGQNTGCGEKKEPAVSVRGQVCPDVVREVWNRCLAQCKIRKEIPFAVVQGLPSPMAVGVLHPRLLLPAGGIREDQLYLILLHEASHLKAGDLWAKAFCQLALALHWFNPLCRRLQDLFELDMESACDERVLRMAGEKCRKQYCATILSVVRSQMGFRTAFSTQFAAGPGKLKKRLEAILTGKRRRMFVGIGIFLLLFTVCSGSALSLDVFGVADVGWENVNAVYETTYPYIADGEPLTAPKVVTSSLWPGEELSLEGEGQMTTFFPTE